MHEQSVKHVGESRYSELYGEVKDLAREAGSGFGLPGYRLHVYI
jgi:hypothetical protein